mgnify:CR=1 FL=1
MLNEREIESCYLGQFIPVHCHHSLLMDQNRMHSFKSAIHYAVKPGAKVLELEQRLTEVELATDHHHMEHHLAFDALPEKLWATLGENGTKDDEFMLGAGI